MEHNEVDITHTVKASAAKGRKLIKNIDTGDIRWDCDDEEHDLEPARQKPPSKAELKRLAESLKALHPHCQD